MKRFVCLGLLALAMPALCPAVSREMVQLQREVAILDDRVQTLQRSVDERMGALLALLQQTLDRVNEIHTANAVMDNALKERLRQQGDTIRAPVASLGAQVGQMSTEFLAVRDLIADSNARFKRLEQKIVDLDSAVRSQPALPAAGTFGGRSPDVSAESLFENAMRDMLAGNYDLALRQFSDYVRLFGNTAMAADAQFHIGQLHYNNHNLPAAVQAFDLLLEQHPQSARAADARYLKAMALERQGEAKQASQELNRLIREYPKSDAARLAKELLRRPSKPATRARP